MEHYVYLTTNLITGQQYVGDHTINPNEKKYYLGSGTKIKEAVNEYGENNFFKEILEWFDTRKDACKAQEKYIRFYKTHISQGGYNISFTGGTSENGRHCEETKQKISLSNKTRKTRIIEYNKNPSHCLICNEILNFKIKKNKFCSKSCQAKNLAIINIAIRELRINDYNENPKKCKHCNKPFPYKQRHKEICYDCFIKNRKKELNYQKNLMKEQHFLDKIKRRNEQIKIENKKIEERNNYRKLQKNRELKLEKLKDFIIDIDKIKYVPI